MVSRGLDEKLATDLLLLRFLGGLFSYRKFTSLISAGTRALSLYVFFFFNENLLFCNLAPVVL